MGGNQMAYALKDAGLIDEIPRKRVRKGKQFHCKHCGTLMENPEWANFMWCPKCEKKVNYFIFSGRDDKVRI